MLKTNPSKRDCQQFGPHDRQLRLDKSHAQAELASWLGVSVSYVRKVENEQRHFGNYPTEKFLSKLTKR